MVDYLSPPDHRELGEKRAEVSECEIFRDEGLSVGGFYSITLPYLTLLYAKVV